MNLDDPTAVAAELERRGLPVAHVAQKIHDQAEMDEWIRLARLGGANTGDRLTAADINRGRLVEAMEADRG